MTTSKRSGLPIEVTLTARSPSGSVPPPVSAIAAESRQVERDEQREGAAQIDAPGQRHGALDQDARGPPHAIQASLSTSGASQSRP